MKLLVCVSALCLVLMCTAAVGVQGCSQDSDCGSGEWCRATEKSGVNTCVKFLQEFEACQPAGGEQQAAHLVEKCANGVFCQRFSDSLDAAGACARPCVQDSDCSQGTICSEGLCLRADASQSFSCLTPMACGYAGLNWLHADCLGYANCVDTKCEWVCAADGIRPPVNNEHKDAAFKTLESVNKEQILAHVGMWRVVNPYEDAEGKRVMDFCVERVNESAASKLTLNKVVRLQKQLVAGAKYDVILSLSEDGTSTYAQQHQFIVWLDTQDNLDLLSYKML